MSVLLIFYRTIKKDDSIKVAVEGSIDGQHYAVGQLAFPNKTSLTKFIGAIQKGALGITDLEVRMENKPLEAPEEVKVNAAK